LLPCTTQRDQTFTHRERSLAQHREQAEAFAPTIIELHAKQGEEEADQYDATGKIWSIDSRKIAVSTVFMSYDFSWRFNTTILHGIKIRKYHKIVGTAFLNHNFDYTLI
jgi:hypothetical protein